MTAIDAAQQILARIPLPSQHHPVRIGVRRGERLLNIARSLRHGYIAGIAALLEHLHVVDAAVSKKLMLVTIECARQLPKHRVTRIEPPRPRESSPLSLRDHMSGWEFLLKI